VVGVALKFEMDIRLKSSAHQQPQSCWCAQIHSSILYKLLAQHQQRRGGLTANNFL
jgi:hypothetical protein